MGYIMSFLSTAGTTLYTIPYLGLGLSGLSDPSSPVLLQGEGRIQPDP